MEITPSRVFCLVLGLTICPMLKADTPANCTYEDVKGSWTFFIGESGFDRTVNCSGTSVPTQTKLHLKLMYPDVAVDEFGNEGFWTMVYNQGFEVVIHGRKFFAFSKYEKSSHNVTSYCDQTMVGASHDLLGNNWACYYGKKKTINSPSHSQKMTSISLESRANMKKLYRYNSDFINKINGVQSSWWAGRYSEYESMTIEQLTTRAGGRGSRILGRPKPAEVSEDVRQEVKSLPNSWDWRDRGGVTFVSPVRNQASCGSCYSFSSMGMNEARFRVVSNNTLTPTFSPQDVVECSYYSQGCAGGFPYLIAGKYAEDFGLVEEKCNPYKGKDGKCSTTKTCKRWYSTGYRYVGGYYGGCNEALMKLALVKNGPMSVSFQVYGDFMQYKGGVYHHTSVEDKFNPFEITNHAVLLVGYGADESTGQPFWIVKNSWGETWGEKGYFRILRGVDECSIESIAVESFPMI